MILSEKVNEGTGRHFIVEVEEASKSSGAAGLADFQEIPEDFQLEKIPDLDEDFRPANIPVRTF